MQYKVASRSSYDDDRTFVREHVLVAEKKLGRRLRTGETVHHIDKNKANNNPDNLMIFATNADHSAFHKGVDIYEIDGVWHANTKKEYVCEYCHRKFTSDFKKINKRIFCSAECFRLAETKCNISKELLLSLIIETNGNFVKIGNLLGITDNAVRKKCKRFGLPYRSMECRKNLGALAQLVERSPCTADAVGSTPTCSTARNRQRD